MRRALARLLRRLADALYRDEITAALDSCYSEQEFRAALQEEAAEMLRAKSGSPRTGAILRDVTHNADGTQKMRRQTRFTRRLRSLR